VTTLVFLPLAGVTGPFLRFPLTAPSPQSPRIPVPPPLLYSAHRRLTTMLVFSGECTGEHIFTLLSSLYLTFRPLVFLCTILADPLLSSSPSCRTGLRPPLTMFLVVRPVASANFACAVLVGPNRKCLSPPLSPVRVVRSFSVPFIPCLLLRCVALKKLTLMTHVDLDVR